MAVLSEANRASVYAALMAEFSRERLSCSVTKAQFRAALDATDAWIEANAASHNAALPLPARTALTTAQKNALFRYVAQRRQEVS